MRLHDTTMKNLAMPYGLFTRKGSQRELEDLVMNTEILQSTAHIVFGSEGQTDQVMR